MSKTGNPPGRRPRPLAERFWEKVDKRGPDECWPWLSAQDRDGYGLFYARGKQVRATAMALEFDRRPLRPGEWGLHTCDNPPCLNPAHLYAGTHLDNVADKVRRGRQARGPSLAASIKDRHALARWVREHVPPRLSAADVAIIRAQLAAGVTRTALALRFGVSRSTIRAHCNPRAA